MKIEIKKYIFLVDGIGALISTFLLGVIFPLIHEYIGLPVSVLYILAAIPLVFSIYSLSCFGLNYKNQKPFLAGIVVANASYCLLTSCLLIYHFNKITLLGVSYFIIESIIVMILASYEYRIYKLY